MQLGERYVSVLMGAEGQGALLLLRGVGEREGVVGVKGIYKGRWFIQWTIE